jgi:hypothetical protein
MFFESVKVKKTDWHYKLMLLVYGESLIPQRNFCPYFWMAILAMFGFAPIMLFRGLYYLFKNAYYSFGKAFLYLEEKLWGGILNNEDDLFYAWVFNHHNYSYLEAEEKEAMYHKKEAYVKSFNKIWDIMYKKGELASLESKIAEIKQKRLERKKEREEYWRRVEVERLALLEKKRERERIQEEAKRKRIAAQQIFYMKWGKKLGIVFGGALSLTILYLGYYLFSLIQWGSVLGIMLEFLMVAGIITGALAIGYVLYIVLRFLWLKVILGVYKRWLDNYNTPSWLDKVFGMLGSIILPSLKFIWSIIRYSYLGVVSFFSFFWTMFMAWKNNNCPGIDWEDK